MAPSSAVVPPFAPAAPLAGGPGPGARARPAMPPRPPAPGPVVPRGDAGQPRRTPPSGT